jgi:hypothetical protein
MRRLPLFALILMLAATACGEETPTGLESPEFSKSHSESSPTRQYRVTIENLTEGQPFTPPLAATHARSVSLFRLRHEASFQLQEIAENGNLDPMIEFVSTNDRVADWKVTFGPTAPPVLPGEMVEFEIESTRKARYLSIVSMLICTNDGFTGTSALRLPKWVGDSRTVYARGYDAGTETNTEAWPNLVPPCAPLTGFDAMGQGTGMSDPALAEHRRIRRHRGIVGDADLQRDPHDWKGPVARIKVERIS